MNPTDRQLEELKKMESIYRDILENSVDLDPEINDLINQNFWKLI